MDEFFTNCELQDLQEDRNETVCSRGNFDEIVLNMAMPELI